MPTFSERVLASIGSMLFGIVCYNGKVASFALHAFSASILLFAAWNIWKGADVLVERPQPQNISAAFFAMVIFSGYAALSAVWAASPEEAAYAGFGIFASAVACQFLVIMIGSMPLRTLVNISGWQIIGIALGTLAVLVELRNGYSVTMWIANNWLIEKFQLGNLVSLADGKVVYIQHHTANWGVAAANIMLWPSLCVAALVLTGFARALVLAGLVLLVVVLTFASDHQTTQIALPISAAVWLLAWRYTKLARGLLIAGCVAAFALVMPGAKLAFERYELDRVPWVHPSLQARIIIWGVTADKVAGAPLLGIGAKSTKEWLKKSALPHEATGGRVYPLTTDAHAHNNFLQTWFELGAVGVLLLASALVLLLQNIAGLTRKTAPFAIATAATALIISFISWSMWNNWYSALIAMAIALLAICDRICRADGATEPRPTFGQIWLPRLRKQKPENELKL